MVDAATGQPAAVKLAIRTLAIFEYIDNVRRPARTGEIAAALGFPQSSATYLLKSLVGAGHLEFKRAAGPSADAPAWRPRELDLR